MEFNHYRTEYREKLVWGSNHTLKENIGKDLFAFIASGLWHNPSYAC
jgi:hypothetical protein